MKKLLCFLLLFSLLLLSANALMEAPAQSKLPESLSAPELTKREKEDLSQVITIPESIKAGGGRSSLPTPSLSLRIDSSGRYHLTTQWFTISADFPFGWYVFTQDYLTQLQQYITFDVNIESYVTMLMENGRLFQALSGDANNGYCELSLLMDSAIGRFVVNLNDQDATIQEAVMGVYQLDSPDSEVRMLKVGRNNFISVYQKSNDYEAFYCDTYVNGICVRLIVFSDGPTMTQQEMEDYMIILESLEFRAI